MLDLKGIDCELVGVLPGLPRVEEAERWGEEELQAVVADWLGALTPGVTRAA